MSKQKNESLNEYRSRVLDSKSDSFCGAKWGNATIWLGHGETASCHHPPSHNIDIEEIQFNPSAIHNTKHKKAMRALMQKGERPDECEYCWKVEDIGPDSISDRVYKSIIHDENDLNDWYSKNPDEDVIPNTLEIAFDRTCNMSCSYCNPAFSSTWVKDIRTNGGYENIISDGRGHFVDDAPYAEPFPKGMKNPYIEAFWNWWPELSQKLKEIRITGGEPLMSLDVWKLFQWFENNESDMRFAINSNLSAKSSLIERLIEKSHYVKNLHIYTSCEAYGKQAEYIRDGLHYGTWKENIDYLLTKGNVKQLHMMMTINALCLFSITDFLDDMLEIKRQYGSHHASCSLNILRFPSFQSPLILPFEMRKELSNNMKLWLENVLAKGELSPISQSLLLNDWETNQITRLVEYLVSVETPHAGTAAKDELENDFKSFYSQYDVRREKNIKKTFPDNFNNWWESLEYKDKMPQENISRRPVFTVNGKEVKVEEQENIDEWFDNVMAED